MRILRIRRRAFVCGLCFVASGVACREQNPYVEPAASSYVVKTVELAKDSVRDSIGVAEVQPDFFPSSKASALLGRLFTADDHRGTARSLVVISQDLWVRRFGSAPSLIGTNLQLNGQDATIVGVVPANFAFPKNVSAWVPGPPK